MFFDFAFSHSKIALNLAIRRFEVPNEHERGDSVPDRRCMIFPEVALVLRWVIGVLGIWRGEGLGKGLGQGRSVYKQPETEVDVSCHS
jgi:hypothetical protein